MKYSKYLISILIMFLIFSFNVSCVSKYGVDSAKNNNLQYLFYSWPSWDNWEWSDLFGWIRRRGNNPPITPQQPDLRPFFKLSAQDNSDLPLVPALNQFDIAILKVCGVWGSEPTMQDLKRVFDDQSFENNIKNIYNQLKRQIKTPNASLDQFKDELLRVWFANKAFKHIFCGEPKVDRRRGRHFLGGLHFVGRYIELQRKGVAGAVEDGECPHLNRIYNSIYELGVRYKYNENDTYDDTKINCSKSFDIYLHAEDIFIDATKAYTQIYNRNNGTLPQRNSSCLYEKHNNNGFSYMSKLAYRDNAIVTFYPDLNPKCADGAQYCPCK